MSKKVVELIRVSTEGQAAQDRAGMPAQRAANRRTATQHGLEIVKTIELADVSGCAVLRTPEMGELLRLMESPDIAGVVTREFSRLMRPENFTDYALLQHFTDTNTTLYLPEGPIDLGSKSGRLMGVIRAAIAGHERLEILDRIWAAKEEKRKAGKNPQSRITLPFGVDYDETTGWSYTAEAEKVREAFALFLAGDTSYWAVGRMVGIEPYNLRIIMRNPIYMGWRIIDQRRDPRPQALRTKPDGRQADRPKIARKAEEIIRCKVLDPPLVTEDDFRRVQQILDAKKQKHWRVRPDYKPRFTYSSFLRCASCGNLMYTHVRGSNDWYFCKSRTTAERKLRKSKGLPTCGQPYLQRERLDCSIDHLFSRCLTDPDFLGRVARHYAESVRQQTGERDAASLGRELKRLDEKRLKVLDAYFDGQIDRPQCDQRLATIDQDRAVYRNMLAAVPAAAPELSAEVLGQLFGVFFEWELLPLIQKRRMLPTLVSEIHVRNYHVEGIRLIGNALSNDQMSHSRADSSTTPRASAPARRR